MTDKPAPPKLKDSGPQETRVCPACGLVWNSASTGAEPGRLPRCPQHGLAYVREADLPASGHDPFLGKTLVDRFVILSRIGAGSMGAVYRARQEAVGRDVALKIVRRDRAYDPETKARFEREARAMSSLVSPNTVTVFDFGEADDGSWFLAMEMLRGETLGQRLRREHRLGWKRAVRISIEALTSLSEAHKKGIIHRDLKPDNLFLMRRPAATNTAHDEICKVLDFGIAKLHNDDQKLDQLETQAGTVFGTPRYMSPEQAQGIELDARSDVYSLGVILFQMLTGRPPFVDDDAVVVMAKHIKDAPPSIGSVSPRAQVPEELERLVLRALSKKPTERQTADELLTDLVAVLERAPVSSSDSVGATTTAALTPVARPSPPERLGKDRRLLAAVVFSTALVIASFAAIAIWWSESAVPRAGVEEDLTLSVPAAMPHRIGPAVSEVEPEQPVADVAAPASAAASVAPTASLRNPAGPPTRALRLPNKRPAEEPPADEVMEPKRPDERYGRFR